MAYNFFEAKYEKCYNDLLGGEYIVSNATSVANDASAIISRYDALTTFVSQTNWTGESKDFVISSSLPALEARFQAFKSNISSSLTPACETAINELLVELKNLKEKNDEFQSICASYSQVESAYYAKKREMESAKNYYYRNGEKIYTYDKDNLEIEVNALRDEKNRLSETILLMAGKNGKSGELGGIQDTCDALMEKIKGYQGAISDFSGTISSRNSYIIQDIEGLEDWRNVIYEIDGVYYQIPLKVTETGAVSPLDPNYTICIDSNAIKDMIYAHYGEDTASADEFYNKFITFFNAEKDQYSNAALYDWSNSEDWDPLAKKVNINERELIGKIMDKILEDTYAVNDATTIKDFATIAGVVATSNSFVRFDYNNNYNSETIGFYDIITTNSNPGCFDCNTLVKWAYNQGFKKLNPNAEVNFENLAIIDVFNETTPLEKNYDPSTSETEVGVGSILTLEKIANGPGTLSASGRHIGMVIGFGTDEYGNETVITAEAAGKSKGVRIFEYSKDNLYESWNRNNYNAAISDPDWYSVKMCRSLTSDTQNAFVKTGDPKLDGSFFAGL